jgi:hypothetical protein
VLHEAVHAVLRRTLFCLQLTDLGPGGNHTVRTVNPMGHQLTPACDHEDEHLQPPDLTCRTANTPAMDIHQGDWHR